MKRTIYLAGGLVVALMVAGAAHASGNSNNSDITNNYDQRNYGGNTTNAGGLGGQGGAGGLGGTANGYGGEGGKGGAGGSVLGSGNSSNLNTNANLQGQQQQANGGTGVGTSTASGGIANSGSTATGNGAGNSTSVNVAGSTSTYKEAAQSLYLPNVPDRPLKDCRLYISIGGSSRDGQAAGGIPIGNSQICLSDVQWTLMTKVNGLMPGAFTPEDFLVVACKVEGMSELSACKAK